MISRLVHQIRRAVDADVSAEEIADALWLSDFLPAPEVSTAPPVVPERAPTGHSGQIEVPELPEPDVPAPETEPVPPGEMAHMTLPPPRDVLTGIAAVPSRSPAAPAIPEPLVMSRALRPLRRRVTSRTERCPDEDTTARLAAETGVWVPRTRPTRERWLSLDLVVDDSASMVVWHRTVAEFRAVLQHLAAFRHIRVWRFDGDLEPGRQVTLWRGESRARHAPGELIDPAGRTMVLVVSDCVGQAWGNGVFAAALACWATAGPVAITQVLPQRLWSDCHPEFLPVRLRGRTPGVPNARLLVESREPGINLAHAGFPVPVCELDPRWQTSLAQLVAGGPAWVNSSAVFTGLMRDAVLDESEPEAPTEADGLVRRFRSVASTDAYQLARCFAGAPLSLPVMRLVQNAMMPRSRPSHLAEVFLSGLLTRDHAHDGGEAGYDFLPGVRQTLLDELASPDALQVLDMVSAYVSKRLGSPRDFLAVLTGDQPIDGIPELARPFAAIAYEVLRRVGGRYREAAELLRSRLGTELPPAPRAVDAPVQPRVARPPAVMGGVPLRNPHFTGRTELLGQLRHALETNSAKTALLPHTLHGLGGVGKTQLAVEYVHRYATQYDLIWWVPAEEPAQIRASLVELGARMGLPSIGDSKRAVAAVLDALRTGRPYLHWLLVFDNCDNLDENRQFLPHPTGQVLITSRNRTWADHAQVLEVDVLAREESIALLRRRRPDISTENANALAEWLGDLPLALEQAAAWQAETGMSVREYLNLLEHRIDLLARRPVGPYPKSVAATWSVGFETLEATAPAAARVLELCAFFGPVPIGMKLLRDGAGADLPSPLRETLADQVSLGRVLTEIGKYALAKVDAGHIEVHRLVQAVVRGRIDVQLHGEVRERVQRILVAANPGEPDAAEHWPRYRELMSHVMAAAVIYARHPEVRRVAVDLVRFLYASGDHVGSERLGRLAMAAWRAGFGRDDELTLIATRHWANAVRALGNVQRAAQADAEVFERFRTAFGDSHPHTLATANSVGADLRALGRFAEALVLDEDNLRKHREEYGTRHPLTLRTANNLAVDRRLLGDARGALQLDEEIVRSYEATLGPDHRTTLHSICNLARDLIGLGRYAEALRRLESVLPRYERIFDAHHAVILRANRTIVVALRRIGDYPGAERLAEQNFVAIRTKLGGDHEHTLTAMMSYANALRCTGQLDRSLTLAEEAHDRYQRNYFGPHHPFTLACALNLAIVLRCVGRVDDARELSERTVDELRNVLSAEHPAVLCGQTGLSNDLLASGETAQARALSVATLELSLRVRGPDHPYTYACMINAGQVEEGTAALARQLGADHPEVVAALAGERLECDIEPSPS